MTPPRTLGRYAVGRLLGEGAMGRVYLAHDPELGRDVAIKLLRLEAAGEARDAYIARFRNEARAAARFSHPNVVAVYDAGVDPTAGPYLVYEYVAGSTLRARIGEGRLETSEIARIARGVGAALDALHAARILHRDIKPDNILLAPDGAVKLTDFGIARVPDAALTRDGQFLGTPAYAAPEAITRGEYSTRGDVFSFAAVLYESLCGIRPFPGEDAVAVSFAVVHDTAPPPSKYVSTVSPAVDAVFERALKKRPADRFATATELAATLAAAFRGSTASSSAVATMTGATRRPQHGSAGSSRPSRVGPAILVVMVLAALAWAIARRQTQPSEPAAERVPTTPVVAHPPQPAVRTRPPAVVRPPRSPHPG